MRAGSSSLSEGAALREVSISLNDGAVMRVESSGGGVTSLSVGVESMEVVVPTLSEWTESSERGVASLNEEVVFGDMAEAGLHRW